MVQTDAGPAVLYGSFVSILSTNFFIFPAMLLSGQKEEENVWRQTGLMSMCLVIVVDLVWANLHPSPVAVHIAAVAAGVAAVSHMLHLMLAFGVLSWPSYSFNVAMSLQFSTGLPWILVSQFGTAFVVGTGRSPARFQMLAWITVMVLGTVVTLYPTMRNSQLFVIGVASAPRVLICMKLLWVTVMKAGKLSCSREEKVSGGENDNFTVGLPSAARFAVFACNGSTGEALNDMATDLKIRTALSTGDTELTVTYNAAVVLSMLAGFVSETLAAGQGARRIFAALWGLCQVFRSLGMELLTPDRTWLMFVFVFCDKFTGPLGQAAIDTALLALMRRSQDSANENGWPRIPANALWTLRTAAERLERPTCQLLLLRFGTDNAPPWLPILFAIVAVCFVQFTLRTTVAVDKKQV